MEDTNNRQEYMRRIHKVQDYIETHLEESITLEELSKAAGFSKFHFDRIFKSLLNESLSHYVTRLKLNKAAQLLVQRKDLSVTDIAYHYGFSDSAVFSRSFKSYYSQSPASFRKDYSKNCKDPFKISAYNHSVTNTQRESLLSCSPQSIEIVHAPSTTVAYVRHVGTYQELAKQFPKLIEQLLQFIAEHPVIKLDQQNEQTCHILSIYHDNPEFAPGTNLRTSLCITLSPHLVKTFSDCFSENMGLMNIPAGMYVVGHFQIKQEQYSDIWDYMYEQWLTNSAYLPRDADPFEVYMNDPHADPSHTNLVDIWLPIEPLHPI